MHFRKYLAGLWLALVATSAHAEPTLADFKNWYAHPMNDVQKAYIVGLLHGIEWTNADSSTRLSTKIYCPPGSMVFTVENAASLIEGVRSSGLFPDTMPIGAALEIALTQNFKCK
jgi:hypothetical protein